MKKPFTIYHLPFTVHLPFTLNGEWTTDNVWKMENGELITGGGYEH